MRITTKDGEVLEFEVTETHREPHSVTIARNAKGEWSFEVKCYGMDGMSAAEDAEKVADRLTIYLSEKK